MKQFTLIFAALLCMAVTNASYEPGANVIKCRLRKPLCTTTIHSQNIKPTNTESETPSPKPKPNKPCPPADAQKPSTSTVDNENQQQAKPVEQENQKPNEKENQKPNEKEQPTTSPKPEVDFLIFPFNEPADMTPAGDPVAIARLEPEFGPQSPDTIPFDSPMFRNSNVTAPPLSGNSTITNSTTTLAPRPSGTPPAPGPAPAPQPAPGPAPAPPPALPADSPVSQNAIDLLNLHNQLRRRHGAPPLSWNTRLANQATQYANQCRWGHSNQAGVGENLFISTGSGNMGTTATQSWYNEVSLYNFNSPGFASATGHFTQLVWIASSSVGCGFVQCPGSIAGLGGATATYVVCQYYVPGNFLGQFPQNVRPAQ